MLTILIIICLGTSFYAGYRRGLMLQLVYGAGYIISFMVAHSKYKSLGKKLELLVPYPAPTEKTSLVLFDKNLIFDFQTLNPFLQDKPTIMSTPKIMYN